MLRHRREQGREQLEEYLAYLVNVELCRRAWGIAPPPDHAAKVREVKQALAAITATPQAQQLTFDLGEA